MTTNNPAGLNGFAFLEFSGPNKQMLHDLFIQLGFTLTSKHKTKDIYRYQQGHANFLLNNEPNNQAQAHQKIHGSGACAMGFNVDNATQALAHTLKQGGDAFNNHQEKFNSSLHAIHGIGGSLIYFCDKTINPYEAFSAIADCPPLKGSDLYLIDHLTHNVFQGNLDTWANFYTTLFNFHEIRFFDISGDKTGLLSRAMGSPCGKIKIPLNESKDDASQIAEFINDYHGEGIQHIALLTENIYDSVEAVKNNGINFLDVPTTYYDSITQRLNWHNEDITRMKKNAILIDGADTSEGGLLLQIFTKNVLGPAFFEIIQRKGNNGFGEGNFSALFEAIERDQMQRGVI